MPHSTVRRPLARPRPGTYALAHGPRLLALCLQYLRAVADAPRARELVQAREVGVPRDEQGAVALRHGQVVREERQPEARG